MAKRATTSERAPAGDAGGPAAKRGTGPAPGARQAGRGRTKREAPAVSTARSAEPIQADTVAPAVAEPGRLVATAEAVGRTLGRATAVISDQLPWTRGTDGLDLLERDHRRLEALLKQAVDADAGSATGRTAALEQLAHVLIVHEQMEEKVLYPALKSHGEATDIVLEGYQEHHVADVLLRELRELPTSDERWGAKLKVLQESLEHHIGEEEGEMFKTARAVLSREQLREIRVRMEAMQEDAQDASPPSRSATRPGPAGTEGA